jgi:hypothetical protein
VARVVVGHFFQHGPVFSTIKLPKNGQCPATVERLLPSSACYA